MNEKKPVVLITGASSGIGKETAKTLIGEGYTVYAAARRVEKMEDLRELAGTPLKMDITKEEDVVTVIAEIKRDHGGVDILINNAGFATYGTVEDTTIDDARYQFEVNLFGLARMTQEVLPHMREKRAGKIVNISSMGGKIYTPLGAWYHATKHALEGWSDCLRLEVASFGIDVIIIEPGAIETEFASVVMEQLQARSNGSAYSDMIDAMTSATQNGNRNLRGSDPSVVAEAILKAIQADRPRTRYVVGRMARPLIYARRFLGDRLYDWAIMSQLS